MHILEVCFSPALGGLELYCLNTAKRLAERGHEVHLWLAEESRMAGHPAVSLQRKGSSPLKQLESSEKLDSGFRRNDNKGEGGAGSSMAPTREQMGRTGIPACQTRMSDLPMPIVGAHSSAPSQMKCSRLLFNTPGYINPLFTLKAASLIRERGIEVIHLHRSQDLALFAPLNIPKVLTLQIQSSLPKRDLWHRWVYSRVDRILTITHRMRDLALKSLPVSPDKVQTLHYGIAADELYAQRGHRKQTRQSFGIPEEAFLIGLVGRLEASKGQDILLRAFAQFRPKYPQVHLLFAGDPPREHRGYDQHLRDLAPELGLAQHVHFIGFQADTAPIFAALDLFVLASKQEAFGLVLLEAMAQGIPIIATRAGGVPEVIQDDVNGLLVNPGDEAELAEALERLIGDADWRRRLGEAGFRIVREKFELDAHLHALEAHFRQII